MGHPRGVRMYSPGVDIMELTLETPVAKLPLIGPTFARRLKRLGIETAEDLLYHFPFRYEDYSIVAPIVSLQDGETVTVQGEVSEMKNVYTRHGKKIQKAKISDDTGTLEVVWYNQPFLVRTIHQGQKVSLSGKVSQFGKNLVMESPDYEILKEPLAANHQQLVTIHTGRLVPIYPETGRVSSKWLRSRINLVIKPLLDQVEDYLPKTLIKEHYLCELREALFQIHFPDSKELAQNARKRLSFDELFLLQLTGLKTKGEWEKETVGHRLSIAKYRKEIAWFWEKIPFELTEAQKRAIKEIFADLAAEKPMNRLLEGDVGSGKTVIAAIAMYVTILNGYQTALMAPTEILAFQHFETISKILSPLGVKIGLITGSRKVESGVKGKGFNILIGTHALLSEKINFRNLGLVVIDEQHRFGVEQRAILRQKGINPHLLTLTATPIPRTVALTLYGELDLSYLDQMPPGRKEVKTWVVPAEKRPAAYGWIEKQIRQEGTCAFIICPLIEESETLATIRAATAEYEKLQKEVFPKLHLGLLHGRMKGKEKEAVINDFRNGKLDILVATPVVEVGIDIPNATIMFIEGAERFGLAQLHQLRGRVGRGEKQSYCLLFTETQSPQAVRRLKALESLHSGAELAELDLKLRGPGEVYGTAQHGLPKLKLTSFSDFVLIEKTHLAAQTIIKDDLGLDKYPLLQAKLKKATIKRVSPD